MKRILFRQGLSWIVKNNFANGLKISSLLAVAYAAEALTQPAPGAASRCFSREHNLRLAFIAETFLPGLHGAFAGSYGHGTKINAAIALLAEFRTRTAERMFHAPVLATPYKAYCFGLPYLAACPYTAPAQNTVIIAERIADLCHSAEDCDVLDGT